MKAVLTFFGASSFCLAALGWFICKVFDRFSNDFPNEWGILPIKVMDLAQTFGMGAFFMGLAFAFLAFVVHVQEMDIAEKKDKQKTD